MKRNIKIALLLNILIIIFELIGFVMSFKDFGFTLFEYYTQDSNLIALLASIFFVIYALKDKIPNWVKIFRYVASSALMLTFLVVIFILIPTMKEIGAFNLLFDGTMLYHHTLCPLISLVSFVFFEKYTYKKKNTLYALSFTVTYALIITTLNILKLIKGPYPFLYVYEQPLYMSILWFIIIVGGSYGITLLLGKLSDYKSK